MIFDLQTKLIVAAIAAFILSAACGSSYLYGHSHGKESVQSKWNAENLQEAQAGLRAQAKAQADNKAIADKHSIEILKVRTENKNEVEQINARHAADLAYRVRVSSSKGSCVRSSAAAGEIKSTGGGDETAPGTFVFSEETSRDLREHMREADLVVASCRALQNLVISEGLYVRP